MEKITIGVVAKEANVGVETVRFYERKGIISQPPKSSGFRTYSKDTFHKKNARTLFQLGRNKRFYFYWGI